MEASTNRQPETLNKVVLQTNKEGLYEAVLKRGFNAFFCPLHELSLDQLPPETALEQFVQCLLSILVKNPN